jgi:hypothetical protein
VEIVQTTKVEAKSPQIATAIPEIELPQKPNQVNTLKLQKASNSPKRLFLTELRCYNRRAGQRACSNSLPSSINIVFG